MAKLTREEADRIKNILGCGAMYMPNIGMVIEVAIVCSLLDEYVEPTSEVKHE